jgi:hypothetical protein
MVVAPGIIEVYEIQVPKTSKIGLTSLLCPLSAGSPRGIAGRPDTPYISVHAEL